MVLEKVITFISEQFSLDEEDINEDTTFEELEADEQDVEDLIHVVEGEFEIKLHDDEIIRISDVSDLVKIIETAISLAE
ncbi:MAG: phosphopantetheine-binding protein [Eubacteriales bacterium]